MTYFINIIKKTTQCILVAILLLIPYNSSLASDISVRLKGRILLQVESNGEAWYVNPDNFQRYFLGRPADAFQIMRELGLGISNKDFNSFNGVAPSKLSGKILLKVEDSGKAFYINPVDLIMYYLGRPADAFQIMRKLGLGITNNDLGKILKYEQISTTKNNTDAPASSPVLVPIPVTSASAITSPPPSLDGINTHTELYGTGADPDIITLGPKVGGHPDWKPYQHKPGMSFEAYQGGSPVIAPFDMVLVGFRDTGTQIESGGISTHSDDVKLFFESASPDWPGVYLTVYHLLTSPLLPGHTQRASNDLMAPPAQGYQLFWDGNYTLPPQNNAASYGALIGFKVKRGELIGFAGTVPAPNGIDTHSFADFYFDVPDASVNPNIKNGKKNLHLVQPGSFFYWKSYSPDVNFPSGVLAYPFEIDGYQLPVEQRDVNYKYTAKK